MTNQHHSDPIVIVDEEFIVTGGTLRSIAVRMVAPTLALNGHYACSYEITADGRTDVFQTYGGSLLQAVLFGLGDLADRIDDILERRTARIDSILWDDLRRLKTPQDQLDAARAELVTRWGEPPAPKGSGGEPDRG